MGFFDRIRHPVSGTATVMAATSPTGMRSPQEVRMTLSVQGIGFDPFTLEHEEKCHTDRWPTAGMQVPIVFDADHHERLEVQWDDVQPSQGSTPPPTTPQPVPAEPEADIPPQAQQVVDQLQSMFGGAQMSTHVETKVIDLSNNPEARAQMLGPIEQATGMDLDGDGRIGGGSIPPPAAAPPTPPAPSDDTVSRLERLAALHKQGVLTDTEFAQQKAKLLGG